MAEEDTEWNTILREKGILPPSQQEFQKNKNDLPWIQSKSISTKLKEKEEEEEEEEEEDLDLDIDEKMFEHFKNERLKEYQTAADLHSNRGTLITLESHEEFTKKVTKASVSMDVIVHLFDETLDTCTTLDSQLNELASRYLNTRFCRMKATTCISNYPLRHVPTLLVYHQGEVKTQLIQTQQIYSHHTSTTLDSLTSNLHKFGVLK